MHRTLYTSKPILIIYSFKRILSKVMKTITLKLFNTIWKPCHRCKHLKLKSRFCSGLSFWKTLSTLNCAKKIKNLQLHSLKIYNRWNCRCVAVCNLVWRRAKSKIKSQGYVKTCFFTAKASRIRYRRYRYRRGVSTVLCLHSRVDKKRRMCSWLMETGFIFNSWRFLMLMMS